jgi:hypothetical protein
MKAEAKEGITITQYGVLYKKKNVRCELTPFVLRVPVLTVRLSLVLTYPFPKAVTTPQYTKLFLFSINSTQCGVKTTQFCMSLLVLILGIVHREWLP